jgi:beta-lactamase class A
MPMNPQRNTTALRRMVFSFALLLGAVSAFGDAQPALARRPAPTPTPSPTPIPTPTPTPIPTTPPLGERVSRMNDALLALVRASSGNVGIAVYDPASDTHFSIHGDKAFPLASTYKLAIALTAFHLADERKLNLDQLVPIRQNDLRHGHSPLADLYPQGGVSLPLWKLVRAMLVDSDSTASDLVLRVIGAPSDVQNTLNYFNLGGFAIRKSEADLFQDAAAKRTFARGGDNAGTPDGLAALLIGVANLKFLSLDATTEFLLDIDASHTGDTRLRAGFPAHTTFGHKSGTSDTYDGITDATNDAGLLTLPDGHRIAIVVLISESSADEATRDALIANVGKIVYATFAPP